MRFLMLGRRRRWWRVGGWALRLTCIALLMACGRQVEEVAPTATASPQSAPLSTSAAAPYWKGVFFSSPPSDAALRQAILDELSVSWWLTGNYEPGYLADARFVPVIWGVQGSQYLGGPCPGPSCLSGYARGYRGRTWLLFSEPERPDQANLSPADAARHATTIINTIRAADSSAKIMCCGTRDDDSGLAWMRQFLQTLTVRLDGIHVHSYTPGYVSGRIETLERFYSEMQTLERGRGLPIWISEIGYPCGEGSSEWVRDSLARPFFDWYRCGATSARFPRVAWFTTSRSTAGWTPTNLYDEAEWTLRPLGQYYQALEDVRPAPPSAEPAAGEMLTADAVADTYLNAWAASQSFGLDGQLAVRNVDIKASLLLFDLSALPPGSAILRARLLLYTTQPGIVPLSVDVHRLLRRWNETEATWELASRTVAWAAPGANDTTSDRAAATAATIALTPDGGPWYVADLTALVTDWAVDPGRNYGLLLRARGDQVSEYLLASRDHADGCLRPRIEIWYEVGPPAPTLTAPTATPTWTAAPQPTASPTTSPTAPSTVSPTPMWTATLPTAPTPSGTPSSTATSTPAGIPSPTRAAIETRVSDMERTVPAMATRVANLEGVFEQFGQVEWLGPGPEPSAPRFFTAYRVAAPPTVNGDLSEWSDMGALVVNAESADYRWGATVPPSDPRLTVRARWDDRFLYLACRVQDASIVVDSGVRYWEDDGIEIGIDGNHDRVYTDENDYSFAFRPDGAFFLFDRSAPPISRAVRVRPGQGYDMEFAIPLTTLCKYPVTLGSEMGINFGLRDDDDGRTLEAYLIWEGNDARIGQAYFGALSFSGEVAPHIVPERGISATAYTGMVELQQGVNGYTGVTDTYLVAEQCADLSFAGDLSLGIGATPARRPLLRFDLTDVIPADAVIVDARLSFRPHTGDGNPLLVEAYRVFRPWSSPEATWEDATRLTPWAAPGADGVLVDRAASASAAAVVSTLNIWYDLDITSLVQAWVMDPAANHGVILVPMSGTAARYDCYASEALQVGWRPKLTIYYRAP